MNGAYLQARLLEAKARIEAVKCRVAGMQAENDNRKHLGQSMTYPDSQFTEAEMELVRHADEVKSLGDAYADHKGWKR